MRECINAENNITHAQIHRIKLLKECIDGTTRNSSSGDDDGSGSDSSINDNSSDIEYLQRLYIESMVSVVHYNLHQ